MRKRSAVFRPEDFLSGDHRVDEACMEDAEFIDHPDVDEILWTEAAAYEFIEKKIRAK